MNTLLVVCEANICRSPMAEGLLRTKLGEAIRVRSAGFQAWSGMPADETAIRLLHQRGIDIAAHRALQITRELCIQSDLILVMSSEQRTRLEEKYAFVRGRVFRVCEAATRDVPDPYRQGEPAFLRSLEFIEEGVRDWLERIRKLKRASP
jgi:protein-tyrosine phosphatase